jgi:enoyl-CoA hydratase/carnithine racemase
MLRAADYQRIRIEARGAVAVLTLDRPERRNAVDDRMHSELATIFRAAQDDSAVRAVVLTGAGEAFSVGGDTSPERRFETAGGRSVFAEARAIIDGVLDLEKPLVAAVNGHAIGLGATLASLADLSFVERRAKLGDRHVLAALPAGNGSAVIWPLLVGVNRAKQLLMAGELLTAEQAVALGLLGELVEDGTSFARACEAAERLAALAPHAVQGTKAAVNQLLKLVAQASLPASLAREELAMQHPDYHSAIAAFAPSRAAAKD